MEMNLRYYFNETELEEIKRIIDSNEKVPLNKMGKGIDSIALKVEDATEEMQEKMKSEKVLKEACKAIKYISVHGATIKGKGFPTFVYPGAEVKYVFFNENKEAIAILQENENTREVTLYPLKHKKFELSKIKDAKVEMYHEKIIFKDLKPGR